MTGESMIDRTLGTEWHASWWLWSLLWSSVAGIALASLISFAYYNDPFRPLAHTLGIWVALAFAVSWRRPKASAVAHTIVALTSAVVTYYIGLKVGHDIRWADQGSFMTVGWDRIQMWTIFAVVAGAALGWLGSLAAKQGWIGAAAAAAFVGLILGDGMRRALVWGLADPAGMWDVAVLVDGALAVLVFLAATRGNRRPWLTAAFIPLVAAAGLVVVWVPDTIEQLLV